MDEALGLWAVEPQWERVPSSERRSVLCVGCAWSLMYPPAVVEVIARGEAFDISWDEKPGPRLLELAVRAAESGFAVRIDRAAVVGIFAVTQYKGDALCAAHLLRATPSYPFPA